MSNREAHIAKPGYREAVWRWSMFGVVLVTIPAFYIELAGEDGRLHQLGWSLYLFVFAAFALHLARVRCSAPTHRQFLRTHWLDLLIAAGAAASLAGSYGGWSPVEWLLRSLFLALIVARIMMSLRHLFSPSGMVYLVGLAAVTLGMAGAGFYWLEPTVSSYADGLWLAFESGATVGYGDLIPTTPASRLFAAFMVLLGYALMSLVTASIAAVFVGEDEKTLRREMHHDIKQLREEVASLSAALRPKRRTRARGEAQPTRNEEQRL